MTTYDLTSTIPTKFKKGDILNCPYSGSAKSLTLPKGIYKLEVWGAQGGGTTASGGDGVSPKYGGTGGYSVGTLELMDKTIVYCYAGGVGESDNRSNDSSYLDIAGGFNGGGLSNTCGAAGGGGGASDIRIGHDSIYARVVVAGGGGGAGWNSHGFPGGGVTGIMYGNTANTSGSGYYSGAGGSTSGGAMSPSGTNGRTAGSFGNGGHGKGNSSGGGGGGGGWYGGGGSGYSGGSGGGSGYVYTSSTVSNYPSGCLLDSTMYLTDASTIAGNTSFTSPDGVSETGHTGNGYVRITVIKGNSATLPVNIDGNWKESESVHVNVDGTWKEVESMFVNVDGTWKEVGA